MKAIFHYLCDNKQHKYPTLCIYRSQGNSQTCSHYKPCATKADCVSKN